MVCGGLRCGGLRVWCVCRSVGMNAAAPCFVCVHVCAHGMYVRMYVCMSVGWSVGSECVCAPQQARRVLPAVLVSDASRDSSEHPPAELPVAWAVAIV